MQEEWHRQSVAEAEHSSNRRSAQIHRCQAMQHHKSGPKAAAPLPLIPASSHLPRLDYLGRSERETAELPGPVSGKITHSQSQWVIQYVPFAIMSLQVQWYGTWRPR